MWEEEFLGIRELGGAFVFTMHPQVIGRPGRLPLLDGMIEHVRRRDDVWIATCREVGGTGRLTWRAPPSRCSR